MFIVIKPYKMDNYKLTQRCSPSEKSTDSHDIPNPLPATRLGLHSFVINITCRYCQEIKKGKKRKKKSRLKCCEMEFPEHSCIIAKGSYQILKNSGEWVTYAKFWAV